MHRRFFTVFAIIAVLFGASSAFASMSVAMSMEELVGDADQVVVGTVVSQQSRWDEHRRIVTDVTIRVEESIKGRATVGQTVVVTRLGGEVGDLGMRVEGEATFEVGERAIVFAEKVARGRALRTVGMSQGVLPIRVMPGRDRVMREHVLPGAEGLALLRRNAAGRLVSAQGAITEPRLLDDVLRQIRQLARARVRAR